jgi:hypothetical protein
MFTFVLVLSVPALHHTMKWIVALLICFSVNIINVYSSCDLGPIGVYNPPMVRYYVLIDRIYFKTTTTTTTTNDITARFGPYPLSRLLPIGLYLELFFSNL